MFYSIKLLSGLSLYLKFEIISVILEAIQLLINLRPNTKIQETFTGPFICT